MAWTIQIRIITNEISDGRYWIRIIIEEIKEKKEEDWKSPSEILWFYFQTIYYSWWEKYFKIEVICYWAKIKTSRNYK